MNTPTIERKLAVIFSADFVGYSRLMGVDEAGTLANLSAYREVIDELFRQRSGPLPVRRTIACSQSYHA